ncbi:MAG: terpene cyclase/mutase family protein [Planctomycetes bacterium]|nr:terpene cyclase/mutase family protein [Planctomycetota bacterium]
MAKQWLILAALSFLFQDGKRDPAQGHPKVDQKRVDQAIEKGIRNLKERVSSLQSWKHFRYDMRHDELVLWSFVHAGVPEEDPEFQRLLTKTLDSPIERTYLAALRAMVLEEVDRLRYQMQIARCAQFLIDNQCSNGQWFYGEPSEYVDDIPTGGAKRDVATKGEAANRGDGRREKPRVVRKITLEQKRKGPWQGDNSNTQYAALGLRACHDAGIVLPKAVVVQAARWWEESVKRDGSWCYGGRDHHAEGYGSMSAGAVGSLVILNYILGQNWKNDRTVVRGLEWLRDNFTVKENPGKVEHAPHSSAWHHYYYLYALERAGVLYGTETLGSHEWYPEGANYLLDAQRSDGSWGSGGGRGGGRGPGGRGRGPGRFPGFGGDASVADTCFAILFLRRATRPLQDVPTVDDKRRHEK